MSDSVRPHRRQPTRLPHPWDSPGKNTGVGCHFLLQCMKVKEMATHSSVLAWSGLPFPSLMHESESEVAQSLGRVQLLATPWTAACQAPPSMEFSSKNTGVHCHFFLQALSEAHLLIKLTLEEQNPRIRGTDPCTILV